MSVTAVSSTTANGAYRAGDVISIQVSFSEAVTVDTAGGTPQLTLETGAVDRAINYAVGSGTNTLTFSYTVQAGDTSADLDYLSTTALALNGGTIRDAGSNDEVLTLPTPGAAGSLGANNAIVIDTTAPTTTIATVSFSADTGTSSSDFITKTAAQTISGTTSANIAAGEVLWLSLDNGSTWSDITSKVSGNTWSLSATLAGSDTLKMRVSDAAGNDGTVYSQAYVLDTTAPAISFVSVPSNGAYKAGDNLDFTVNWSEAVTVDTSGGTPRIALTIGSSAVFANYVAGSGTSALVFRYTVQAGDTDSDGIAVGALQSNGGTLQDAAGNNSTVTLNSVASTTSVLVDTTAPDTPSAPVLAHDTGTPGDNVTSDPTITYPTPASGDVLLYKLDAGSFTTTAPALATDGSADGQHTVMIEEQDSAGNVSGTSSLTFTLDSHHPQYDFNGDGKADILWQNDNGTPEVWLLNGDGVASMGTPLPNPGPSWHAKEAADFNSDGKADILWQNDNGTAAVWLMDSTGLASMGAPLPNPGPSWHAKEAADFNGDGKADILWQNDNGTAAVWLMDSTGLASMGAPLPNPGPIWHMKAAADFNDDGKADILWQNDNGTAAVWLMDGTSVASMGAPLPNPGPTWHAITAGDFNGDGKADILWQHDSGIAAVWLMDGTSVTSMGAPLPNPGPAWHAVEAVDANGDGKADILWQHDSGAPAVWLMEGTNVTQIGAALHNAGAAWHIV